MGGGQAWEFGGGTAADQSDTVMDTRRALVNAGALVHQHATAASVHDCSLQGFSES